MATNRETYKTDEQLARAFDWHCNTFDCKSCKHSKLHKENSSSRSRCLLAWAKDEADTVLVLEPCRFCGTEARLSYGDAVISCRKCGYEIRRTYISSAFEKLKDSTMKVVNLWNKLQKGS